MLPTVCQVHGKLFGDSYLLGQVCCYCSDSVVPSSWIGFFSLHIYLPVGFCPSAEQIEQIKAKSLGEDLGLGFLESFSSKEDITRCEWPRGVLGMDHLVLGLCFVIVNPFENMFSPAGCWATACVFPPAI